MENGLAISINFRGLPPDKTLKKYELIKVKVKSVLVIRDLSHLFLIQIPGGTRGQVPCPRNTEDGSCVFIGNTKKEKFPLPRTGFRKNHLKNNLYIFWVI